MSIGEVLALLRPEFPGVTISKLRFLEDQGLVEPRRAPSGYRKFSPADVDRLRYVLGVQRDHYLPLRVIRAHLEAAERGSGAGGASSVGARSAGAMTGARSTGSLTAGPVARGLPATAATRAQLVQAAGGDEPLVSALESFGLLTQVSPGRDGYDAEAMTVVRIAGALAGYGIEPRHLRSFRAAADREAGLVDQVAAPLRSQRGKDAADRAEEVTREVAGLTLRLHAALLRSAIGLKN